MYKDPINVSDIMQWFQTHGIMRARDTAPHTPMPFAPSIHSVFAFLRDHLNQTKLLPEWETCDQYLCSLAEGADPNNAWRRHLVQNTLSACGASASGAGFDMWHVPDGPLPWFTGDHQPVWKGTPGEVIESMGRVNTYNANTLRLAWVDEICRRLEAADYPQG